ncbi:MAG: DUF983 domain-containing protein [Planctomycetota bacterium]
MIRRLWAILTQRCPRCLKGRVFCGLFKTHDTCPTCGLSYQREPGYFLGAMYFSYGFGVAIVAPITWYLIERDTDLTTIAIANATALILTSPLLFRYARILWLHFDQLFHPR